MKSNRLILIAGFQCHAIQNKNQNHSIDQVQILRKERRWICKDPRQFSGHSNFSYARYAEKHFTQIYRDLYGAAMLVPIRMGTTWRLEINRNICHWVLLQERELSLEKLKNTKIILFSNTRTVQIAKFPEISPETSHFLTNSALMQMPRHAKT